MCYCVYIWQADAPGTFHVGVTAMGTARILNIARGWSTVSLHRINFAETPFISSRH